MNKKKPRVMTYNQKGNERMVTLASIGYAKNGLESLTEMLTHVTSDCLLTLYPATIQLNSTTAPSSPPPPDQQEQQLSTIRKALRDIFQLL